MPPREMARRQRRIVGVMVAVSVPLGIVLGVWVALQFDWADAGAGVFFSAVYLSVILAGLVVFLYRRSAPVPRCPSCQEKWDIFNGAHMRAIEQGRCPRCSISI